MKNLLFLLVIILFFGCASKKTITHSDTTVKANVQNAIADTNVKQENKVETKTDKTTAGTKTTTKETDYDSTKPVDPKTGKPPVKREVETTIEDNVKKDVVITTDSAKKDSTSHIDNSKSKIDTEVKIKKTEIPKTPGIVYALWIVGIIAAFIAFFFLRKNWIRIKTVLGFVSKV